MKTTIEIILALSAMYCAFGWIMCAVGYCSSGGILSSEDVREDTFHLGLCFVLALGFLGLML